ncbi:MAG: DUF5677 domain-containing protein [Mangrovicoccus sp.]|nr:DUF5677 domain-containing protein [Mangrovicoccus sp.]
MNNEDALKVLENAIFQQLYDDLDVEEIDVSAVSAKFVKLFELVKDDAIASAIESHKALTAEYITDFEEQAAGFVERVYARWKPSFDCLEMMFSVARELGELHGKAFLEESRGQNDAVMLALANIFPRALLVTREIICLLRGGFPDGALARWRSLHELTVTAMYIAKHGECAAISYFQSFHFAARRAARQMNEHSVRAQVPKFSEDEMKEFDTRCEEAERILGRRIEKDSLGEWPKITGLNSFAAIEKDVDMDHWRPRYKWASGHTHAHFKPMAKLLGMAEAGHDAHLVGSSNSGFVDPFSMTAISLSQITGTYLLHGTNADRIIHTSVMQNIAREMGEIALDNERATSGAFKS